MHNIITKIGTLKMLSQKSNIIYLFIFHELA